MREVKTDIHFPSLEKTILEHWKTNQIIEKGLKANEGKEAFVFFDGPPFATGLPHYGHILAGTLKDIVPRYWVMKGKYCERRWGWDCHGLPVEFEMEKELGLESKQDIEAMGIAKFNEACRNIVQRYTKEWEEVIYRTGRWADFKNGYKTMDRSFMESVWWVVKQLWDKGYVYEGFRVMPYSWRITTPLSNFEANLNYKEVQDPALTVKFKAKNQDFYFLAWTTTPWTLPSNLALSLHPELTYALIEDKKTSEKYVLLKERIPFVFKDGDVSILKEANGKSFEGSEYEPLFPYFKNQPKAFRVLVGEHVTTTDGTGIVHTAPAFGEEDFEICKKYGIELVDPVDSEGKFTKLVPDYQGQQVKDADKAIIKDLKNKDAILKHETLVHNYPFCWRSDTPLIYKAISTWFVKLDPVRDQLVQNNKETRWVPEHLRDGRFGNWLENARDWNISRNRYWGTPIPIWRNDEGEMVCLGSAAELEEYAGRKLDDIHKHFIDDIEIPSKKGGKPLRRIPEVLDCWFESGSMPYGQAHYPFENKEKFEKYFPADFIAEGIDQTRGWFYTLSVLGTALMGSSPFKNVIVNGLVLASDGKKMSKRLKNYPEVGHILDTYGADSMRAYLMTSPASHAEDLKFTEAGVKEMIRGVLLPLWNAYSFFVTYALADEWSPKDFKPEALDKLEDDSDRWILSRLQTLVESYESKMANYHLYEVIPQVLQFLEELTNWYIRLNRRRYWSEEKNKDKNDAYSTLFHVLNQFTRLLAPILPFVTEEIYLNLFKEIEKKESIHLCDFPKLQAQYKKPDLEKETALIQKVVFLGRNLRNNHKLKTRQPLKEFTVITSMASEESTIKKYADLIAQELNVKKVSFSAKELDWVTLLAKPNAKVLGPRLGQKMKEVSQKIRELASEEILKLEKINELSILGEKISLSDIQIERSPKQKGVIQSEGSTTVWLDTDLDEGLIMEGRAREIVNRIQKLRKDSGFQVTDKIKVEFESSPEIEKIFTEHKEYLASETLASEFSAKSLDSQFAVDPIDELPIKLKVIRGTQK